MRKPGVLEENSGARSMRRLLALGCFFLSGYLYHECARKENMSALYAGMASEAGMLLLLFFTTWSELRELVAAARGGGFPGRIPRGQGRLTEGTEENPEESGT